MSSLTGADRLLELNWARGLDYASYDAEQRKLREVTRQVEEKTRQITRSLGALIGLSGREDQQGEVEQLQYDLMRLRAHRDTLKTEVTRMGASAMHADDHAPDARLSPERSLDVRAAATALSAAVVAGSGLKEAASHYVQACLCGHQRFSAAALRHADVRGARSALRGSLQQAVNRAPKALQQLDIAILAQMMLGAADKAGAGEEEARAAEAAILWAQTCQGGTSVLDNEMIYTILGVLPPPLAALATRSVHCAIQAMTLPGTPLKNQIPGETLAWPSPVWEQQDKDQTRHLMACVKELLREAERAELDLE